MQLHQKFIEIAKTYSKKVAVYDISTRRDITYSKILIISLILAKKFSKYKGKYIGLMVPTSAGCMISILGILMSGKIPVMINYSTGAIYNSIYAQEKCGFNTIIASKKLLEKLKLKPISGMIFLEEIIDSIVFLEKSRAFIISKLPTKIIQLFVYKGSKETTSVILFTSGSEKDPKAVQLSHKNIFHNIINIPKIIEITSNDVYMANLPLFHIFGLTVEFWLPICLGASIVAYPNPLDYKIVSKLIKNYHVDIVAGTPSFFYGYLKKSDPGDFSGVRIAIAGADKLTPHIQDGFRKKHNISLYEGYGTTETSPVIATNTPTFNRVGSVGKPIPGIQVKIIDRETDEILPPNTEGKILVKGDLVTKGYLGDLEETSLRIRNGWYETGDMGFLDEDGFLWHRGRLKRFVKIGGEMVSLVKVENVLEKFLPKDTICCVVDVPSSKKGAYIVAALTTGEFNKKKILRKMAKELPPIALPKSFHIIKDIPMMPSGKVNFREVEKICREYELINH